MFEDYSLDSWIKLVLPGRKFEFVAVSTVRLDKKEQGLVSRVGRDPASNVVVVKNSGGVIEPPWRMKSDRYLAIEIAGILPRGGRILME